MKTISQSREKSASRQAELHFPEVALVEARSGSESIEQRALAYLIGAAISEVRTIKQSFQDVPHREYDCTLSNVVPFDSAPAKTALCGSACTSA
jgi:hypothetical protein